MTCHFPGVGPVSAPRAGGSASQGRWSMRSMAITLGGKESATVSVSKLYDYVGQSRGQI